MKTSKLKSGMIVFDRRKNKYVVIRGTPLGDVLYCRRLNVYLRLCDYKEDMTQKYFSRYDIVEVCVCENPFDFFNRDMDLRTIWKRNVEPYSIEDRIKSVFKADVVHFDKNVKSPIGIKENNEKIMFLPQDMLGGVIEYLYGDLETFLKKIKE